MTKIRVNNIEFSASEVAEHLDALHKRSVECPDDVFVSNHVDYYLAKFIQRCISTVRMKSLLGEGLNGLEHIGLLVLLGMSTTGVCYDDSDE